MPWPSESSALWSARSLPRREVFPDFLSHFDELRKRLILSLVAFTLAAVLCYFFSRQLLDFLTEPLRRSGHAELFFQKPYEAFLAHLKMAALGGLLISSPILFLQAWLFVALGLYENEKRIIPPLTLICAALFLLGALFAYEIIIPWGLQFLLSYQTETLKPLLGIGPYFSFVNGMILAFGLFFDFPVVIVGLVWLGVVRTKTLAEARKGLIVVIFILAAVLTPSPDPVSQILLALPLVALFEISLAFARRIEKQ